MAGDASKAPVSVAEMQRLEAEAFGSGRVSSRDAMECAGTGVTRAVCALATAHGLAQTALVLCGPGNNGGDGYVVARLLRDQGWTVHVAALGVPDARSPDAAANRVLWLQMGMVFDILDPLPDAVVPGVIVDALFGIGLTRGIDGTLGAQLQAIDARWPLTEVPRVAVDVPSGLDADSGAALGVVLPATVSVTFHRPKPVHQTRPELCGQVKIVEIGL